MSLIKPRTRGKHLVRHITRLDQQNEDTLYAYAAFIGEDAEYVSAGSLDDAELRKMPFNYWLLWAFGGREASAAECQAKVPDRRQGHLRLFVLHHRRHSGELRDELGRRYPDRATAERGR